MQGVATSSPGPVPFERLERELRELVGTVREPALRELLDRLVGPSAQLWASWSTAPAAKRYHEAYRHGLLEHSLAIAQGVSAMAATFPGVDRDLAVSGALLHDVGKTDAYSIEGDEIAITAAGKLQGEIALGYFLVRAEIERIDGFRTETAEALLHIIVSHHGRLEYGSPVAPCTREAVLVHMVDNLGARFGSFDRLERSLKEGLQWSGFDRALSGEAYFGTRAAWRPNGPRPASADTRCRRTSRTHSSRQPRA